MMNRRIFFSLILALFLMPYLAGCKGDGTSAIVGKWAQEENQDVALEFFKDGSGILTESKVEYKFTWVAENQRLTTKAENEYTTSFDYKISGSVLTLNDEKFIKIKK